MHVCNDFSQLEGVQTNFEPKVQNFLQFILDFNTMQLSPISVCDFQLAKLGGCFVIATCRARNMEDVWSLGAIKSWTTRRQGANYVSPSSKKIRCGDPVGALQAAGGLQTSDCETHSGHWHDTEVENGHPELAQQGHILQPNEFNEFILVPLGMPKWVWPSINWYRMLFFQTSTLSPRMHQNLPNMKSFISKTTNCLPKVMMS